MTDRIKDMKVGEKTKDIREDKGWSLENLAIRTGLTSSEISQIENQMVSPSLGTLIKLAGALGVSLSHFFTEDSKEPFCLVRTKEPFCLVRTEERKVVSRFASTKGKSHGYSYESLGYGKKDGKMEPFMVTLNPPDVSGVDPNCHTGEEFIFVLEGEVEVRLGDHTDVLRPGDSIYYNADIPHVVARLGDKEAKILAVIWPGEEIMYV